MSRRLPIEARAEWLAWVFEADPFHIAPACDLCSQYLQLGRGRCVEFTDRDRRLKSASGEWCSHTTWYFCADCFAHLETLLALMALEGGDRE
jgi:hypothetical protein